MRSSAVCEQTSRVCSQLMRMRTLLRQGVAGPEGRIDPGADDATGFVDVAVSDATADALKSAQASTDDLRRLIIPRLATWDPQTGSEGAAKRRLATEADLFASDRAGLRVLANALVDRHLLTRSSTTAGAAYEVAHEERGLRGRCVSL
jgi:hypothetical protein